MHACVFASCYHQKCSRYEQKYNPWHSKQKTSSKPRTSKPWMNSSLKASINRRHRVYRKYHKSPQPELYETLKALNKSVAKQMCFQNRTIPDVIDDLNFSVDLKGKAEKFNFYFQSAFTQSVCLPSGPQLVTKYSEMMEICFTERGVLALLQKIRVNAAPGFDAIPNYVLKNCAVSLAPFLVLLFEKCAAFVYGCTSVYGCTVYG